MCDQTLSSLAQTDWGEMPNMFRDTESGSSERTRQYTLAALTWFLKETDADICLFLEDDIQFNVHLRWNLAHWVPLIEQKLWIGSLYTPRQPYKDAEHRGYCGGIIGEGKNYVTAKGPQYGAQAFVISRQAVHLIIRDWAISGTPEHPAERCPSDYKMILPVIGAGHPIYYHAPSLVQHVGTLSVWNPGIPFHEAWDFEPEWKAE